MAGKSRFGRPPEDPDETAERLPEELRAVRERVFRSYVEVRRHGVDLVVDDERDDDDGAGGVGGPAAA